MKLSDIAAAEHAKQGQLPVKCNALSTTEKSLNCYLRPNEAIVVATNLLRKANLLLQHGLGDEWAIHMWTGDTTKEKLKFGLQPARRGGRKSKRVQKPKSD